MPIVSLFDHDTTPSLGMSGQPDDSATVGFSWEPSVRGVVHSIWSYVANTSLDGVSSVAAIYELDSQELLVQKNFTFQGNVGWQEIPLDSPITIEADMSYVTAVYFEDGYFPMTLSYFATNYTANGLTIRSQDSESLNNSRYRYGSGLLFPNTGTPTHANYWLDVSFEQDSLSVTAIASDTNPVEGDSITVDANVTDNVVEPTYLWEVVKGSGNFGDNTAESTSYTPTSPGKQIIRSTVVAVSTVVNYINLNVSGSPVNLNTTLNLTVTDDLNEADSTAASLQVTRGGALRFQERSLYGSRLSFGDAVTNRTPMYEIMSAEASTRVVKVYLKRSCTLTKVRFLKAPDSEGIHTIVVWHGNNTAPVRSQKIFLSAADDAKWVEVVLREPLDLVASDTVPYLIGYHAPSGDWVQAQWVYGSQDIVEWPFMIHMNGGSFGNIEAGGHSIGSAPLYPNIWFGHSYMIDPVVEWPSETTVYDGGLEYLKQFKAYENINHFPIGIWQPMPNSIDGFADLGINTLITLADQGTAANRAITRNAVIDNNMDIFPHVHGGSTWSSIAQWKADPDYDARIKGYFISDEPDMIGPWTPPSQLREFKNEIRKRDPTKLVFFNFGKWVVVNKGFAYLPTGASPEQVNAYWRDFASVTDIVSCDFYMEDSGNLEGVWGLWCNPRMVRRLRDLSDNAKPIWHILSTAAPDGRQPTPETVYRSSWASLIGGARGLIFFDHKFTPDYSTWITDFAMSQNPPMAAMMSALTAEIQSLSGALLAPEDEMSVWVESSNTTAGPVGGEWGVPIHYTARKHGGNSYLFAQSIRPGTTTAEFTLPEAANKTITVINESRTLNVSGGGIFSDNFTSDYQVHLYRWST